MQVRDGPRFGIKQLYYTTMPDPDVRLLVFYAKTCNVRPVDVLSWVLALYARDPMEPVEKFAPGEVERPDERWAPYYGTGIAYETVAYCQRLKAVTGTANPGRLARAALRQFDRAFREPLLALRSRTERRRFVLKAVRA